LLHTNKSHSAEAGHAAALASSIPAEVVARMKIIAVGDMTLLDLYNPYLDAAKQLGAVDEKRARLNQPAVTPAAQVQSARREWDPLGQHSAQRGRARGLGCGHGRALVLAPARGPTAGRFALAHEDRPCARPGSSAGPGVRASLSAPLY
jgi:hypothetical protein